MSPDSGARAGKIVLESVTQRFVDELNAAKAPPLAKISLEEARAGHARGPVVKVPASLTAPPAYASRAADLRWETDMIGNRLLRDLALAVHAAIIFVEDTRSAEVRYPVAIE